MKNEKLKLYWCSTEDHDEDWFILACSAAQARRCHEDQEGYNRGDASSLFICKANGLQTPGWPSDEDLIGLGMNVFTNAFHRRIVLTPRGQIFIEGEMQQNIDSLFSAQGNA